MKFVRPYTYVFSQPDWFKSLLTQSLPLFVGLFIPFAIIGAWPLFGYFALRMQKATDREEESVPPFRLDRFSQYLTTGGWPFAYAAIQFGLWALVYGVTYISLFVILFMPGGKPDDTLLLVTVIAWTSSLVFLWYALLLIMWPFQIHAYLTQSFAFGRSWRFARDFYSRVGWAMAGLLVPKFVLDCFSYLIGTLACCIGIVPAWAVVLNAELHFQIQLYHLYLARGGTPIPVYHPPREWDEDADESVPPPLPDRPSPEQE